MHAYDYRIGTLSFHLHPVFYLVRLKRKAILPNPPFKMSHQAPLEKL